MAESDLCLPPFLCGNQPGTGGLVTFKDSNWLMSIVLAWQPHFPNQPADVHVFRGYALFPDRVGNFVPKPMAECNGAEILLENSARDAVGRCDGLGIESQVSTKR